MLDRIMIIDDHPAIREGLSSLLKKNSIVKDIVEAGNFSEAYSKTIEFKPELILMDISLHGLSGIDLTRKILKELPTTIIIIISLYSKTRFIVESLKAGARGYILKETSSDKIVKGIKKVIAGDIYVDSHISGKVINSFLKKNDNDVLNNSEAYEALSFREQEILRLLADGLDINEISEQLCISAKTVINHRTNIMAKLNCKNIVELIRYAIHIGLVDI